MDNYRKLEPFSIIEAIGNNPDLFEAGHSIEPTFIEHVEKSLEFKYPVDYALFLELYGYGILEGFEIYGFLHDDPKLKSIPNAIWLTLYMREKYDLPQSYAPVGFDGAGGFFCLDTSQMNSDGKCPVVVFYTSDDDALVLNDDDIEAKDFSSFVLQLMLDELEEDGSEQLNV